MDRWHEADYSCVVQPLDGGCMRCTEENQKSKIIFVCVRFPELLPSTFSVKWNLKVSNNGYVE